MKRILLTNDDGVFAPGIYAVAKQLVDEYEVYIVAPNEQKSGASHSLTLGKPVTVREEKLEGLEKAKVYSLTGTPADCVKFGTGALDIEPDLVVSGMNLGANIGVDVMYSGTVGAALEACLLGYPSLALSVVDHHASFVDEAAVWCKLAVDFCIKNPRACKVLSVNIPNKPNSEIKGIKVARLSRSLHCPKYVRDVDGTYKMPSWGFNRNEAEDTDEYLICNDYVTWTPLITDICDHDSLKSLEALID